VLLDGYSSLDRRHGDGLERRPLHARSGEGAVVGFVT